MKEYGSIAEDLRTLREQLALFSPSLEEAQEHFEDWDYVTADTKTETHGFHSYPAMMIPQVARRLLNMFGKRGDVVLDPFCGSGTVLVEAKMLGMNSWGIDINPLALLLARVKSTPLDVGMLQRHALELLDTYRENYGRIEGEKDFVSVPEFFNIDYWFKPKVSRHLSFIRELIFAIRDTKVREFFLVAFSETVREVSNTKSKEFKLVRMSSEELEKYNPDVGRVFFSKVYRNIKGMAEFVMKADPNVWVRILREDTRSRTSIPERSVDLIVTSPPYGDSRTTVAYGQFSRLSLQWLGLPWEEVRKIDSESLGGKKGPEHSPFSTPLLKETLHRIADIDPKRSQEVMSFYHDFGLCMKEVHRVCKSGAKACFVVGNRTVKGIRIPTDGILVELAEMLGFKHLDTYHRNIPSKRMPSKNSPSNIPGQVGETMTKEHIVVLEKV